MAGSVNKVILIGNLGRDPEVRHFEEGRAVASFSIATSETFTAKNGERQERTEWHNITIWRPGLVKLAEQYLKKGNKVYIEGQLRTRSWEDQDKNTRYTTEVLVDNLQFLGSPNTVKQENSPPLGEAKATSTTESNTDEKDDDLPF
ncbi:MAG: single-stranded DNA-binding protein [Crocinitomicaceae bacterium]|nr:single-stranded DNA-binding protein [Crocinitomicaceae bacterium]|tara:strand:+ start:6075 stop:6512 length:438 start_codon:yes stop_codon:yes gene_type:complete